MKLLYYTMLKFQPENLTLLEDNFDVVMLKTPANDTDDVLKDIKIGFAPLGFHYDKEKIDRMPELKVIASNTTGEPHIDREYAESKGIVVFSLKDEQDFLRTITPTAEHAWGLLLTLMRRTPWAFQYVLEGRWDRRPWGASAMLSRLSIGIVGLGRLGSLVALYADAFRMKNIFFYDPNINTSSVSRAKKTGSLKELVTKSDVVSLHLPAEESTHKLFDSNLFAHFTDGAFFINTARAEIVDEGAMLDALENGKLAGAAVDVFDGEFALDHDERLAKSRLLNYAKAHDNLLITPHIGGSTVDAWRETERRVIDRTLEHLGLPSA